MAQFEAGGDRDRKLISVTSKYLVIIMIALAVQLAKYISPMAVSSRHKNSARTPFVTGNLEL